MHPVVEEIVNQLMPYKPEKIILFGSYAYGRPHEDSDVDLVLVKRTNDSFIERFKKARALVRTTTPVDIFVFTPEEFEDGKKNNLLISEVFREGKIIYG
ncbi:nucleotidyltransferase domain-containing protein [Candidatus Microgenomates bacterium]|nr:nucleotidyltransferase domain-containing protein [Candidatus Microgenomates bacterium]